MRQSSFRSVQISRLGIGTVQFGMPYGINNSRGKVSFTEILQILEAAREVGVNFIDSARAYGSSEEELGRAIAELKAQSDFTLCTKLDLPPGYGELSAKELLAAARGSLEESRRALRRDTLDFYLLHDPAYHACGDGVVWDLLREEHSKGTLRHIGVSIARGPEEAQAMIDDPDVDAIQIPFNLLDWRWHAASTFERAETRGVAVFTRSAYLQGLLVMEPQEVERKLPRAGRFRERLDEYVGRTHYSLQELALRYVLSSPGVTSTVVGIDGYDQFMQNTAIAQSEPLDRDLMRELPSLFGDVPESIVNPALW